MSFTAQQLVDAIHAAIDAENTACEHPARTKPVAVAHPPGEFLPNHETLHFVPRQDDEMVDVDIHPDGTWSVWERDADRGFGGWAPWSDGSFAECVEACLDALCDLGVL